MRFGHNRFVGRLFSTAVAIALCAAVSVAAWADCAGTRTRASAKACCANKHHCKGSATPDDCCRKMKDGSSPSTTAIVTSQSPAAVPALVVVVQVRARRGTPARSLSSASFTRPHDPPHLHAFTLLI
jgi:hypothetical protein